jgi:glyoxylase-like metal-dependent hydrolase (beta-lactamase superfamily II)
MHRALPVFLLATAAATVAISGLAPRVRAQQSKAAPKAQGKQPPAPQLGVQKVQGNVYMIWTPDRNLAVSVGDWGALVVDTPQQPLAPAVIAEIQKLSPKPIRYVLNTSISHTDSNAQLSRAGAPVVGGNLGAVAFENGATIVAHENVLYRMSNVGEGQKVPNPDALPTTTYNEGQKEIFFNEEPVIAIYQPAAHTDGDSIVFFRRSDVLVAGKIFDMTTYPRIDLAKGGSIQGVINALNLMLDLAIPRHQQEGGTYIIPGRGRLTDEHDLLEYRDMVTIIRDRIQAGIDKGQTLAQIKAAKPTYEYDPRWGKTTGDWTTDMFIEAVYKSLGGK